MMSNLTQEHDNTSEKFAVDEIIQAELEGEIATHSPNGLCPVCGVDLDHDEVEVGSELYECIDFCRHCGWESEPYYV